MDTRSEPSDGPPNTRWQILWGEATQAAHRGEISRATERLEEAIALCGEPDAPAKSEMWSELGDLHAEAGDIEHAIKALRRALSLDQAEHDQLGAAQTYSRLGVVYREQGDLSQAQLSFREAEDLLETAGDGEKQDAVRAGLELAWGALFAEQGQYADARRHYELALDTRRAMGDRAGTATVLRHLAAAEHELGEFGPALTLLEEARELIADAGSEDKPELIEVNNLVGAVLEDQGHIEEALKLFRESLRDADRLRLLPAKAETLRRIGSALAVQGELRQSIESYTRAIELSKDLRDASALSRLFGDVGDVYLEMGDVEKAIDNFKKALELDLQHGDRLGRALALRRLGQAYQEKGDFVHALEAYRDADRILEETDDEGERAVLSTAWGSLLEEQGKYEDARRKYWEACETNRRQDNVIGVAICLRHMGSAEQQLGHLVKAAEHLAEAKEILEEQGGEDEPELIEVKNLFGGVLEDQGHTIKALDLFRSSLRDAERLNLVRAKGDSHRRIGSALAVQGEFAGAIQSYTRAIEICKGLVDEPELSELYGDLGDVYAELGNISEAIANFKEALELDSMHGDHLGRAAMLRRLGTAYQERGDFNRALEAYEDSLRAVDRTEDVGERAVLYTSWGSLLEEQGRYGSALDRYQMALAIHEMQENDLGVAVCLRHMGSVQLHRGDLARAESHLQRALSIHAGVGEEDKPELIAARNWLGAVHLENGKADIALQLFQQTLEEADRLEIAPARIDCLRRVAGALAAIGGKDNLTKAEIRLRRAKEIADQLKDDVAQAEVLDDLGDVLLQLGDVEEAVRTYNVALKRSRRLDRPVLTADTLMGLARCHRRLGKLDSVRELLEEAREAIDAIDASELTIARLTLELAQLDEDDGNLDAAIASYKEALDAFKSSNDVRHALECHQLLLHAYARQRETADASHHLSEILATQDLGALWTAVLGRLDPKIAEAVGQSFSSHNYAAAIREGFKVCEDALRERAQPYIRDDDKKTENQVLLKAWFDPGARGVRPWTDERNLKGFATFWQGAFDACRHPLAHGSLPLDATDAFAWLAVTHLLYSWLEEPAADGQGG